MCMLYITKTIRCSSWVTAVTCDISMTSFVAGCQRSTILAIVMKNKKKKSQSVGLGVGPTMRQRISEWSHMIS